MFLPCHFLVHISIGTVESDVLSPLPQVELFKKYICNQMATIKTDDFSQAKEAITKLTVCSVSKDYKGGYCLVHEECISC